MSPWHAVDCRRLVVRYGALVAVDELTLQVEPGKVLALLGPNGAGKTSTVETLEGYRRPTAGVVRVLGLDPMAAHRTLVPSIGVMLQRGGIYPTMEARRVLELFSTYYEDAEEVDDLLELVHLGHVARTPWRRLSGGEQQRLSLALAIVGRPKVLFLDEPTAGLDPEGRIAIRAVIAAQRERGVCVLLTTHELPEAERLADEVVIMSRGREVAAGTVAELAARGGEGGMRFDAPPGLDTSSLARALEVETPQIREVSTGEYAVRATATPARLGALAAWLTEHELDLTELRAGRRSLEDVYLEVTRVEPPSPDVAGPDTHAPGPGPEPQPEPFGTPVALGSQRDEEESSASQPERKEAAASGVRPSPITRRLSAQSRAEVGMTLRRGESLLLTIGIPVVLLVFFSTVHLLPLGTEHPVSFLAPGILALAVMGTAMVNLSIATGFERGYGVLKRLASTPLGRPSLIGAKVIAIFGVELLQIAVLVPVALGLGWSPSTSGTGTAVVVVLLATCGFGGIGLLLAGVLRAEVNLAAANALWLLLLLTSGMLAPLSKLPGWLAGIAKALPAAALAEALHRSLGLGAAVPGWSWVALVCWAIGAPVAAALTFRWE
jgi:ABC transporter DrrB family efflux protein